MLTYVCVWRQFGYVAKRCLHGRGLTRRCAGQEKAGDDPPLVLPSTGCPIVDQPLETTLRIVVAWSQYQHALQARSTEHTVPAAALRRRAASGYVVVTSRARVLPGSAGLLILRCSGLLALRVRGQHISNHLQPQRFPWVACLQVHCDSASLVALRCVLKPK